MSQIGDEILSKLDIVDVVSKYVALKKSGVNYSGLCPFHNEKSPSFVVSPQKQIFKCFGCGEGGNALSFYMKIERMDRWEAIQQISKDNNIDISKYQKLPPEKMQEHQSEREQFKYINKISQGFFLESLGKNQETQAYIKIKRKIPDEIAVKFGLGYAPDDYHIMHKFLSSKGFKNDALESCSLIKKGNNSDYYSFFRNRLTIPIWDTKGKIVAFGARALKADDMPKYLNTAETILYKKSEILYGMNFIKDGIKEFDKVIIVEGYMDVIAMHTAGFTTTVATCGTALTKQHMSILKRYTENVYFMFDNDKAGLEATMRGLKVAYHEDIFPHILTLPDGFKDIDELVSNDVGTDQKSVQEKIQEMIKSAKKGFFWVLEQGLQKYDIHSPVEKQKLYAMMFELIQAITGFALQQDYLELLADEFGIKYDILLIQYKQFCKNVPLWQKKSQQETVKEKKRETDKMNLLTALMSNDFLDEQELSDNVFVKDLKEIIEELKSEPLDKDTINELQLWWEKEFGKIGDLENKVLFIKQITMREVNMAVLQHIKLNPNITKEKKERLIVLLNKIKM